MKIKKLGIIKTEYLFKAFEYMFFIEIAIFNAITNKINNKADKYEKENNKNKRNTRRRKKPRVIYSKYAFLFNTLIMIFYISNLVFCKVLTLFGKMLWSVCRFILLLVKSNKEEICKEDTVSPKLGVDTNTTNIIDFQEAISRKASKGSKKALPQ